MEEMFRNLRVRRWDTCTQCGVLGDRKTGGFVMSWHVSVHAQQALLSVSLIWTPESKGTSNGSSEEARAAGIDPREEPGPDIALHWFHRPHAPWKRHLKLGRVLESEALILMVLLNSDRYCMLEIWYTMIGIHADAIRFELLEDPNLKPSFGSDGFVPGKQISFCFVWW